MIYKNTEIELPKTGNILLWVSGGLDSALGLYVVAKHIKENKNVLISAHGNSLRALCKYLFKISDQKINELEIPTGNPLIIEFDNNLEIKKYYYLDETRAKTIIFNQ